jgi:hypothetical protein
VSTSLLPYTCHMSRSPDSAWFHHPKNVRWEVKSINLFTTQFCRERNKINKQKYEKRKRRKKRNEGDKSQTLNALQYFSTNRATYMSVDCSAQRSVTYIVY